jgi:hypothetical protein
MTNLDAKRLFQELGIEDSTIERARLYSYDIGFSFAGESRRIVEAVNAEMKAEDVITFYDYDQQAFLLALDLEKTLGRVYAESLLSKLAENPARQSRKHSIIYPLGPCAEGRLAIRKCCC